MLPDNRYGLESAAAGVRRRLPRRGGRAAPREWPPARGPMPNPRRSSL